MSPRLVVVTPHHLFIVFVPVPDIPCSRGVWRVWRVLDALRARAGDDGVQADGGI